MTKKTERLYASAGLVGETAASALESVRLAFAVLETDAKRNGREVLFDTLELSIERVTDDVRTLTDVASSKVSTFTSIVVSAEAVRR